MKFYSDNQRKAMFAQMGNMWANRFARKAYDLKPVFDTTRTGSLANDLAEEPTRVDGHTGAQIEVVIGPSLLHPHVKYEGSNDDDVDEGDIRVGENTYILAGEDFKRYVPNSLFNILKLKNRKDLANSRNVAVEEARSERDLGNPVFSSKSDIEDMGRGLKVCKFSLSDAGAKRHDELRKELYKKKESGVPIEELRREFVDGMGEFIAKRNPGEDMGDYIKRANTEVKLIEQEAEYLAKLALRK